MLCGKGKAGLRPRSRGRARHLLVISEVAMAMVLLVGAGLMINVLLHVLLITPGFDPANVLTMAVHFPGNEGKYVEKIPGHGYGKSIAASDCLSPTTARKSCGDAWR